MYFRPGVLYLLIIVLNSAFLIQIVSKFISRLTFLKKDRWKMHYMFDDTYKWFFINYENNKFCAEQQYSIKLDGSFLENNFVDSFFLLLQLIFFHASNHLISTLLPAFGYDWFFSKQMNYNVVIHFCFSFWTNKICSLSKV